MKKLKSTSRSVFIFALSALLGSLLLLPSVSPAAAQNDVDLSRYQNARPRLGTTIAVVVYAPTDEAARTGILAAWARLDELDAIFNDYNPESEVSRLSSTSPNNTPVPVSGDLYRLLELCGQMSRRSCGAFDVTVGPLTALWRDARKTGRMPEGDALAVMCRAIGIDRAGTSSLFMLSGAESTRAVDDVRIGKRRMPRWGP